MGGRQPVQTRRWLGHETWRLMSRTRCWMGIGCPRGLGAFCSLSTGNCTAQRRSLTLIRLPYTLIYQTGHTHRPRRHKRTAAPGEPCRDNREAPPTGKSGSLFSQWLVLRCICGPSAHTLIRCRSFLVEFDSVITRLTQGVVASPGRLKDQPVGAPPNAIEKLGDVRALGTLRATAVPQKLYGR